MRILFCPALRIRDSDQAENFDRAIEGPFGVDVLMQLDRFGNLDSARVDRIEGRHRFLKDHRDIVATDGLHVLIRQGDEVAVAQPDVAAGDPAVLLQEPHDREGGDAFARSRLTDQTNRLFRTNGQVDAVDRLDSTAMNVKLGVKILNPEEIVHRCRGSRASRIPSPMRLMQSAVITRAVAGKMTR